jgi:hypothetical protein
MAFHDDGIMDMASNKGTLLQSLVNVILCQTSKQDAQYLFFGDLIIPRSFSCKMDIVWQFPHK